MLQHEIYRKADCSEIASHIHTVRCQNFNIRKRPICIVLTARRNSDGYLRRRQQGRGDGLSLLHCLHLTFFEHIGDLALRSLIAATRTGFACLSVANSI